MSTEKHLFHLMTEKMRDITTNGRLEPDQEDVSDLLLAAAMVVDSGKSDAMELASAALDVASGELSGDMGYHINERSDAMDYLLDALCKCGVLEKLDGDDHTVYLRV